MSAFSIRKQSPNPSGNTEPPPFPAPGALGAWAMASLYPGLAMASVQLPHRAVTGGWFGPLWHFSDARLVLCTNCGWHGLRPEHPTGQWCVVEQGSRVVWGKAVWLSWKTHRIKVAARAVGRPTGLSTVSLTCTGKMRRNWGQVEWGKERGKLFNHCLMGLSAPLEE